MSHRRSAPRLRRRRRLNTWRGTDATVQRAFGERFRMAGSAAPTSTPATGDAA